MVGSAYDDNPGAANSGSIYIFRRNGSGVWTQEAKLVGSSVVADRRLGWSVAIDGDVIVAGAPQFSLLTTTPGKAHIFRYVGSSWTEEAVIGAATAGDNHFGYSVAIDGDRVAVGAPFDAAGLAYVFRYSGTGWTQEAFVSGCSSAGGDRFGEAVAIQGLQLVIGAPLNDNNGQASGSCYEFRRSGTIWTSIAKLFPCEGTDGDQFGSAVALSGLVVVAGAPVTDASQGRANNYNGFAPCECVGDFNRDGTVNGVDLAIMLFVWGPCQPTGTCEADLDGDGTVGGLDLAVLLGSWGRCPGDEDCVQSFTGGFPASGGEGELTEDDVAALLGFQDAASFYNWVQAADIDDVQAAGSILLELLGE